MDVGLIAHKSDCLWMNPTASYHWLINEYNGHQVPLYPLLICHQEQHAILELNHNNIRLRIIVPELQIHGSITNPAYQKGLLLPLDL